MGASPYPPGATFCKTCGYCLYALTVNRCPECGKEFDPANPKTFRTRPRRVWVRIWLRRLVVAGVVCALLLAVAYGGFLGWLYMGWKAEAGARALKSSRSDVLCTRPILPPALWRLLPGDCRIWQERVDRLEIFDRPLSSEQIQSIAACKHLRGLLLQFVPLKSQDVVTLCQCRELEDLGLAGVGVRNDDVVPISKLTHLKNLALWGSRAIDDAALPPLSNLPELRVLHLSGSSITDEGLAYLAPLANLQELYLDSCPKLSDAAVPQLARLSGLKYLWLDDTPLSPETHRQLRAAMPRCKVSFAVND